MEADKNKTKDKSEKKKCKSKKKKCEEEVAEVEEEEGKSSLSKNQQKVTHRFYIVVKNELAIKE